MAKAKKQEPNPFLIKRRKGESKPQALARTALNPSLRSALTLRDYDKFFGDFDLNELVGALDAQTRQIKDGNLSRIEEILLAQSHTLDAIFNTLVRLGINADMLAKFDTYMKFGLRAQSQCRAALETMASIRNPTILMRQTNIAHNQQVNNDLKNQNSQSKVLEKSDGERLDFGTAATSVNDDQELETVGAVHRAENSRG